MSGANPSLQPIERVARELCKVAEIIERHSHSIVIGRIREVLTSERGGGLLIGGVSMLRSIMMQIR
jgi:hypothetical protein